MDKLIELAPYWGPPALLAASSLLNYYTRHYTGVESKSLQRFLLRILEYVAAMTSSDSKGTFKLPGTSVPPEKEPEDA